MKKRPCGLLESCFPVKALGCLVKGQPIAKPSLSSFSITSLASCLFYSQRFLEAGALRLTGVDPGGAGAEAYACLRAEEVVLEDPPGHASSAQNHVAAVVAARTDEGPLVRVGPAGSSPPARSPPPGGARQARRSGGSPHGRAIVNDGDRQVSTWAGFAGSPRAFRIVNSTT